MTLPVPMLATAPALAAPAPAPEIARSPAPAARADSRTSPASRVVRAALCVLLAWTAAVLAGSTYVSAWKQAQAMRRADAAAAATAILQHP